MRPVKEALRGNRRLILDAVIHAALTWGALALSYNTYKEVVRSFTPAFPHELKAAIKSTFPWGIIIFAALYLLYNAGRGRERRRLKVKQYALVLGLYALILNILFVRRGAGVLIVINSSVFYLVLLLLAWTLLGRLYALSEAERAKWLEEILPPLLYRLLAGGRRGVGEYLRKRPSVPFAVCFAVLIVICGLLSALGDTRAAGKVAAAVYFFLITGLFAEVYQFIRHGGKYGNE